MKKDTKAVPAKGAADKNKKKLTPAEQVKLEEEMAARSFKRGDDNKK